MAKGNIILRLPGATAVLLPSHVGHIGQEDNAIDDNELSTQLRDKC